MGEVHQSFEDEVDAFAIPGDEDRRRLGLACDAALWVLAAENVVREWRVRGALARHSLGDWAVENLTAASRHPNDLDRRQRDIQ